MAHTQSSVEYHDFASSHVKLDFATNQVKDGPRAPTYANEPPDIASLTREIRLLDKAIIENGGNKFDGWWYALLDIDELDVAKASKSRNGFTLAALEEQATSGNFYDRVPFEKILAVRRNEGALWVFKDEFLVTRQGFSILRAEWHTTLLNAELKKGHAVRDAWEEQRDEEKGEMNRFSVAVWEEKVRRDEELRWERRRIALERRRRAGESIEVGLVAWVEGKQVPPELVAKDEKQ